MEVASHQELRSRRCGAGWPRVLQRAVGPPAPRAPHPNILCVCPQVPPAHTSGATVAAAPSRWRTRPGSPSGTTATPSTWRSPWGRRTPCGGARKVGGAAGEERPQVAPGCSTTPSKGGPGPVPGHLWSVLVSPSPALRWGSLCTTRFMASSGSSALSSPLLPFPGSVLQALGFPLTRLSSTVGGTVLSIQDETENVFVWEHLQAYEGPSKGAWLGMTFNPKGTKEGGRL